MRVNFRKSSGACLGYAIVFILLLTCSFAKANEHNSSPYLVVLGIGQDAGFPQAGCFKPHCVKGWSGERPKRYATSLALVLPEQKQRYLFEATPDFPEQYALLESVAPSADFALSGIFLTHAHIGHYAGLMFLGKEAMGASSIPVYAMPRMQAFLTDNGPWSQLVSANNIALRTLAHEQVLDKGAFTVTPFLVPHRDEYAETVGYKIATDKRSVVFIPDIDKWALWEKPLTELVQENDAVFIDATFFTNGELPGRDMSKIPHPLVTESMSLLKDLAPEEKAKVWFIHMNHTNPLLNENSPEYQQVRDAGFNIAYPMQRVLM